MANIAKRPNGQWRARYRDAHGNEHARHFTRKIDAQNWLDSVTTAVQTGLYVDPNKGKVTTADWARRWLDGALARTSCGQFADCRQLDQVADERRGAAGP